LLPAQIDSIVSVKAKYFDIPSDKGVGGVNLTFWRLNELSPSEVSVGEVLADQTEQLKRRSHIPVGSDLTDKDGTATWDIESPGLPNIGSGKFHTSEVYASYTLKDGTVFDATENSFIRFRARPDLVDAPTLNPSSRNATAGETIVVTFNATTWDGKLLAGKDVVFFVSVPKEALRLPVLPTPPKSVEATGTLEAIKRAAQHMKRVQSGDITVEFPTKTYSKGVATVPITSFVGTTVGVSAIFSVNAYETGIVRPITLEFAPSPGVSSISLEPISQTVRPGRYAQLTATLTPPMSGVKVDFTVKRVTPMGAELQGSAGEK
jgi:hypothetical protein